MAYPPPPYTGDDLPGSRIGEIRELLPVFLHHPSHVHERDDKRWLDAHPAGFGAVSSPQQGVRFPINLHVVDALTEHLLTDGLFQFLHALATWWDYSALRLWNGVMPMDLIITTFIRDHPLRAAPLLETAERHHIPLDWFLVR